MAEISWLNADRYALADVRREYVLTPLEAYTLDQICRLADPRPPHLWAGTAGGLAEFTGQGRESVQRMVASLVRKGCLAEIEPFRQGGEGTFQAALHERLYLLPEVVKRLVKEKRLHSESNRKATDRAIDQPFRAENGDPPLGSKGRGGSPRVPLTKDGLALGSFLRAFPGAEEVS